MEKIETEDIKSIRSALKSFIIVHTTLFLRDGTENVQWYKRNFCYLDIAMTSSSGHFL